MERMLKIFKSPLVWYIAGIGDALITLGLYRLVR